MARSEGHATNDATGSDETTKADTQRRKAAQARNPSREDVAECNGAAESPPARKLGAGGAVEGALLSPTGAGTQTEGEDLTKPPRKALGDQSPRLSVSL